jgi:hypothetical protein
MTRRRAGFEVLAGAFAVDERENSFFNMVSEAG